ncbi:hypothetical protein [uncultured Campylobacter sp.]|uniref:hypothetical protein n=1 Tax=uncultured Campylobacter sp. TaxID=218934 RepID=UPI0026033C2B|nr:hypothetical protein [uncultured Campylobacter sp.]
MRILNLTSLLKFEDEELFSKYQDENVLTISPFDDQGFKNGEEIKCEIGAISYVLALVCSKFQKSDYFANLDHCYLSAECSVGEDEIEHIEEFLKKGCCSIIIEKDQISHHKDSNNIKAFLSIISQKTGAKIVGLDGKEYKFKQELEELKELDEYDGAVVFKHNKDELFRGGKFFALAAKIKNGQKVKIELKDGMIEKEFVLDESLKGTIALLGLKNVDNYAFEVAKIAKV